MVGLNTAWMTKPINKLDSIGWGQNWFFISRFLSLSHKNKKAEINLL